MISEAKIGKKFEIGVRENERKLGLYRKIIVIILTSHIKSIILLR